MALGSHSTPSRSQAGHRALLEAGVGTGDRSQLGAGHRRTRPARPKVNFTSARALKVDQLRKWIFPGHPRCGERERERERERESPPLRRNRHDSF